MSQDDLDRILLSEKQICTSSSFTEDVMVRIRAESSSHSYTPFPWICFAGLMLVLAILVIWIFPTDSVVHAMNSMSYAIGQWITEPSDIALRSAFLSALASIAGTLILVWFSLRLVGNSH